MRGTHVLNRIYSAVLPLSRMPDSDLIDKVIKRVVSDNSNCVDVGAHRGRFLRTFLKHAPNGAHLAFEPIPHLAEQLRVRFPKVEVHEAALSDENRQVQFHYVPDAQGLSSLRNRETRYDGMEVEVFDVTACRLDDVLEGREVKAIKIDVEGAQYQMLCGARKTLTRCAPFVVFEHGRLAEQDYGTTSFMIFELFRECGLGLQGLEGFLHNEPALSSEEFDLLVKTPPRSNYVAFPLVS